MLWRVAPATFFHCLGKRNESAVIAMRKQYAPTRAARYCHARPSTTGRSAVRGGLDAIQLRVLTALGHQLIVRADLHESGPIEDDDETGHADR